LRRSVILACLLVTSIILTALSTEAFATNSIEPVIQWDRIYLGNYVGSVVQTSDGGYTLGGSFFCGYSSGDFDFWLVKTDSCGNLEWNKTYGGISSDTAYSLIQTSDGGYALAGGTFSFGAGGNDMWLVKTDSHGNMEWNKTYGGTGFDRAFSVVQTSEGGYALAGAGGWDSWLVKTDSYGNMQWNKTYGGTKSDEARDVIQTNDGGYAMVGYTESFGAGYYDSWLVKTDSYGNMQWNKTYGGTFYDYGFSLVQTSEGGYALAGSTYSFGAGYSDFWLVKTDSYGNMEWSRTYGGEDGDWGYCVIQTSDGGFALAGDIHTGYEEEGNADWWLIKTDSEGNVEWDMAYGGAENDYEPHVIQTSDGGYALAGQRWSDMLDSFAFWLVKLEIPTPPATAVTIDLDPSSLNLKSKGKWITAYIEFPKGSDVKDVDASTIMLNDTIAAELRSIAVVDHDGDTIPDLMVKFDRAKVISYILSNVHVEKRSMAITLTITGNLKDGKRFQGSQVIRIIAPFKT
jgi:hypothetical protein